MNMLKGYTQADYSPENWTLLLEIKAAADGAIDNATSVADVTAALANAQAAMAAVATLLEDAKAAAHASLNAALAGYAQCDYSPENWMVLLHAMSIGDTQSAACVEDVTTALDSAQAAMAAVPTLLAEAKTAAHTSLETTFGVYSQDDYSPYAWTAVDGCKTAGDAAIDEAMDLVGVEAALLAAVEGMDAVQTIAQTLAAAKFAAQDALSAALAAYSQADYTGDDWTALNECKTAGDAAIEESADLTGVEAAQSAAVQGMAAVSTIAQTLAAAKSAAHEALAEALETYWESDYIDDGWTVLNGHKTAGDAAIDEATDLPGVEAAQSAAAEGMEAVQTFAQILVAAKVAAHDALASVLGLRVSSDTVEDGTALAEATEDVAADAQPLVDPTEELATGNLPTFATETEAADTEVADTEVADTEVADTEVVEAEVEEAEVVEAEVVEAQVEEADTVESESACDVCCDPQEDTETSDSTPDAVQEEPEVVEPAPEGSTDIG